MPRKPQQPALSADEIRHHILETLQAHRKKARSLASVAATITEIKKAVRPLGIKENDVVVNLDFLVQHGWVIEEVEHRTFRSPKGFDLPSEKRTYKLSDLAINLFEGGSRFGRTGRYAGISIENIGGVTILGDNNVVRAEFLDVFRKLDQLEGALKISSQLTEDQKLIFQADVQTMKDQLAKPVPDRAIIRKAMEGIQVLGSIPGVMELFQIAQEAVSALLR